MKKTFTIEPRIIFSLIINSLFILTLVTAINSRTEGADLKNLATSYQTSPALISNISTGSGKAYTTTGLVIGAKTYVDRTYQVTSLPSILSGSFILQTANDDKQNTSTSFLSFDLSQSSTVYVAYDPRATSLPNWLSGWQKLSDRIGFNDPKISHMDLYSKTFPAGKVSLGGNLASPASGSQTNYFVVAKQSTSTSSSLISGVSSKTGRNYNLTTLAVGKEAYTDRTYKITGVPTSLNGIPFIQTPNEDKRSTSTTVVSFNLSQTSTVYVAYDPRATALPTWLSGWQKLSDKLYFDDPGTNYLDLYSRSFPAGTVSLGGNMASPAAGSQTNYLILAKQSTTTGNTLAFTPNTLNYTVEQGANVTSQSTTLSANTGSPSITLVKSEASWLTLPTSSLGTISFGPSNISSNLTPGVYQATVTANASNYQSASLQINLTVTKSSTTTQEKKFNFQPAGSSTPSGYTQDVGLAFDNGRGYGWVDPSTKQPRDLTANMRLRSGTDELRLRTLSQMQASDKGQLPGSWEHVTANGSYNVTVSAGDPNYFDSNHRINVEGVTAISNFIPSTSQKFRSATVTVQVNDGKLTIDANGGTNTKINYVIITPASSDGDKIPPTVAVKLSGVLLSPGVYANEATIAIEASDTGGSGLASIQYSLNNGSYTAYNSPFKISTAGSYTIRARAIDGNNNQTITDITSFSIVKSSQSNAYMVVENMDKFQAPDRLTFSLLQTPWRRQNEDGSYTPYNANHNKVRLKISNRGSGSLTVSGLTFSNTSAWKIATLNGSTYSSSSLPITLNSGASVEAVVEFIAKDLGGRVKLLNDKLYISSNDPNTPYKEIKLHGLWQFEGEGNDEPYAQEIINAFGFKTKVGFSATDGTSKGNTVIANSDEILSAYFLRADATKPVHVVQMAAYHSCCSSTETFQWYDKGSTTNRTVFQHNTLDGQSLLPRLRSSSTDVAQGTFSPSGAFGFKTNNSYSDRTKNYEGRIGMRIWKAVDQDGNIIPNAYIIGMDYLTSPFVNYDYQDNIYYVSNVKPEVGAVFYSELQATPSASDFGTLLTGASKSQTINLKNLGKTYSNGSSDPSITIRSIEIVGPNRDEFSASMPTTTTLTPQATTGINAVFRPSSSGIKNAALLVHYNNSMSPLRIPLYGMANTSNSTVNITKRIKGGADTNVTIGGKLWEADINYRKGNIKLDRPGATPIAGTDDDPLYQTYLSSNADFDEIRYDIPIANGNYAVRMHFAENFWSVAGARVFNISLENVTQLFNFDIFNEVGFKAALVKDFEVSVTDGTLNLKFNPTANRLALAGVEIFRIASGSNLTASQTSLISSTDKVSGSNQFNFKVYPNPNKGENLHIEIEGFGSNEHVTIQLYDVAGRTLQVSELMTDASGTKKTELVFSRKLSRGMYIIKASTDAGESHMKLVIE
ncbi:malectin domain-containing carbohydrate-binding protein [Pontibacter ramchanderi]|uniref:Putative secreted protein (Por secretion system target) n=1 Tax=Pontibacter ramchanderi TaxID=1179743 RepID=A0A2N3U7Q2_9BACT|nr:malectin domain-containing carbohydrate-binding protein [Pontibacter ramchanderi]PKV62778.1 putative secreted protein (Por secretion system target) [Pontibacter ramchanderi]